MSKCASISDLSQKQISFSQIGEGLYAFTAEGDPSTGIIIGDDSVMIVDAQATPKLARKVIECIRSVTDKPISHVVLTHFHAVGVLGAAAYGAREIIMSDAARSMVVERGAEDWESAFRRFPRIFEGHDEIQGLTWPTSTFAESMTVYLGKRRIDLLQLGRAHTAGDLVVWVPDEEVMFTGDIVAHHSACYCGDAHFREWPQTLANVAAFNPRAIAPGRGPVLIGGERVAKAIACTSDFVTSTFQAAERVAARGGSLRDAYKAVRQACDRKFGEYWIYEQCLPFNVARAYDEGQGIHNPRIWTAERDRHVWHSLTAVI